MVGVGFGGILAELLGVKDFGIGVPDIRKAMSRFVGVRNGFPEFFAGSFAATANGKSHDLTCSPAQSQPNPSLVLASFDETPYLI